MTFITLNMVERGQYDEDTGETREGSRPVVVNPALIRAFYARRNNAMGTRITFNDGGGFAVTELPDEVADKLGLDIAALALLPMPDAASAASN